MFSDVNNVYSLPRKFKKIVEMYGVFFSYEKFKGGAATLWQELIFLYDKERKMNQALDIVKALIISYLLVTIVIFFV